MASPYKLRCEVYGHEKDVRALSNSYFPEGAFLSGSRDVSTRLWTPTEGDLGYMEGHCMRGHSNFVAAICVLPPDDHYPHGLIMTGSNDKSINAYSLESPEPQFRLTGHDNTVCALAAGKFGSLLSGSWDKTAKVWLKQKCVMTLSGHEAAVWAVAILPEGGYMLTGSADKTIRMWRAGKCERVFKGHDDCVRGLAVLSSVEFLSCSNDSTIRRWHSSGECLNTYYGHSNYVYSISILGNGEDFVTGGEDRTLRVWRGGECVQTVAHPTESVWAVCALPNDDVVTGGSDGVIRVFSCRPERQAEESVQKAFEEQVSASTIPTQIGDIKVDNLPGPEALFNPGTRDGQTIMVKDDKNAVTAHQWSASEGRWIKVGDVVGSSGGSQATSGKTLYNGKEYDYVFSVDISEGQPALKLPYNIGDDPWMAAHKFLQDNDLSPLCLDQVANFIVEQTKGVSIGSAPAPPTVSDPFTGGGRYIPGGIGDTGSTGKAPGAPAFGADPFTGGGSYKPAGATSDTTGNLYFPQSSYIFFEQANTSAILGKLREFNGKVGANHQVADADVEQVERLLSGSTATAEQLSLMWKLLQWPPDLLFPVLDVFRLSVRGSAVNEHFFNTKDGAAVIAHLLAILKSPSSANQMLTLRTLCNALKHSAGEQLILAHREQLIAATLDSCGASGNKNVEVALSTLLLNLAVGANKNKDVEAKAQLLSAAATTMQTQADQEANFRLLVCVGSLVNEDENSIALARSLDMAECVNRFTLLSLPAKLPECAKLVVTVLGD